MTLEDALGIVSVQDPLISPDGERVLFSRREMDWEENRWDVRHLMVSSRGGESRRFIGEAGASAIRFSPDGRLVSFLRDVDGVAQVFLMPVDGGEARPVTDHETEVEAYEWAGDGRAFVFLAAEPRSDEEKEAREKGEDAVIVDEGPNGLKAGRWKNLWLFDVEAGSETRLTDERLHVYELEVSPSGDRVLFTARASSDRNDIDQNEIYLVTVDDGRVEKLTDNRAVEDSIHWAPDGRSFSFEADDDREWTHKADKIWVMDLEARRPRLVSGAFTEGRIARSWWSPDGGSIKFSALVRTDTNLYELDLATGAVRALTGTTGNLSVGSLSADHSRMVYSFSDFDTPPDLFTSGLDAEDAVRLTDANPRVREELLLASMEVVRWTSHDGLEIEGLLYLPPGYQEGTRVPLLVNIHGGPPGFWDNTWWAHFHLYGGMGYASLAPNVRGSAGYSDELREANTFYKGDGIGFGDYHDVMTGVDYAVERGVADPERLAVRGWSYGAILGGYVLTRTDRFKAAALGAGVYDWPAEFGIGYHWDVERWYIGGTPWTNREAWERQSTITHAANITTPVLLLHGMADDTTTEPQSMILYAALKSLGNAPVRYVRFPREPHGFREPRHLRTRSVEEIRWMEGHVRGVGWEPAEAGR